MASRGDILAGRAYVELFTKDSALIKGLNAAKRGLQSFGSDVLKIGASISALGSTIVGPITAAVGHFVSAGSALADMSARTGLAASNLAELGFAAQQSGTDLETVEAAIRKMQKGGFGNNLDKMAAEISAIESPTRRAQRAMEVFGKSGTMLLPMLKDLKELRAEAQRRGLVPTDEAIASADALGDALDKVKATGMAVVFELGAAVAPALMPALETIAGLATATAKWVRENGSLIRTVALVGGAVFAAGTIIAGVGAAIFGLGTAFGFVGMVLSMVGAAVGFVTTPLGLLLAGLGTGVFLWARFSDSGQKAVKGIASFFKPLGKIAWDTINGIGDALAGGKLELAGQIAMTGLKLAFAKAFASLKDLLGGKLGDALGTITTKILKGDFRGAWDTVVKGMAVVWDSIVAGLVKTMTDGMKKIGQLWNKTTAAFRGALIAIDFGLKLRGDDTPEKAAERAAHIKMLGGLGIATDVGAKFTGGTLDAVEKAMRERKDKSKDAFDKEISGGGGKADTMVSDLEKELALLRAAAAAAKKGKGWKGPEFGAPETGGGKPEASVVTFSGTALQLAGDRGGLSKLIEAALAHKKLLEKQLVLVERHRTELSMMFLTTM